LQHRSGAEFKLFDEMRDRPDVQPLSFNIDRKIGEVATFLRQQGYTFPVLLASSCVDKLLGEVGIPQLWIVDAEGKWLWEQIGFDSRGDKRRESVLEKMGAYKSIAVSPEVLFGR
jgi:hypothetical protein